MKEHKIGKERRRRQRKVRERVREKVRGEVGRGSRLCRNPLWPPLPSPAEISSPQHPGADKLKSLGSATSPSNEMTSPLPGPACSSPGLQQSTSFPLSVRTRKDRIAGPTDCKLFLKEHFAMGFPSSESILGMSIASVWHKNAESIFLINNYIVISCHSDSG